MRLETQRLILRELTEDDWDGLCAILQDEAVMYAYEHAFSDQEVREWLDRQLARYEEYGHRFGLCAVILKETGRMIGQAGLTIQDCDGEQVLEIGYLFQKRYWHQGYAAEAALACKKYAFGQLDAPRVYSIIRDNNTASQKVAARNGMKPVKTFIKHYYGVDMPHLLFCVERER
ncbi:MAG: GNAT family N-acetyltransferase [Oscillospiraceae bacterium]|nr:GNAT family N-acetyltransferase [Oscillospiraceae bacterium]